MNSRKLDQSLKKWFAFLWISIVIILSSIAFVTWSYLSGFVVGSIFAVSSYFLNEWLCGLFLSKQRKFKTVFMISLLKFSLWSLVLVGLLIAMIYANQAYNQWQFAIPKSAIDGSFNIFWFIVGSSMVMLTIILVHFKLFIKEKYQNKASKTNLES